MSQRRASTLSSVSLYSEGFETEERVETHILSPVLYGYSYFKCAHLGIQKHKPSKPACALSSLHSKGETVSKVCGGDGFCLFLCESGRVYVSGTLPGADSGQDSAFLNGMLNREPRPISNLHSEVVSDIACGMYHALFLCKSGSVYSCGCPNQGQLGKGHELIRTISRVALSRSIEVAAIFAASHASCILGTNGKCYMFGCNATYSLGVQSEILFGGICHYPTTARFPSDVRIVSVSMSTCHTLFLAEDGRLFGCGENASGQVGWGSNVVRTMYPAAVPTPEPIVAIRAASSYSLCVGQSGRLYGAGYIRPLRCTNTGFLPVLEIENAKYVSVDVDMDHIYTVTDSGRCLVNGCPDPHFQSIHAVSVFACDGPVYILSGIPMRVTSEKHSVFDEDQQSLLRRCAHVNIQCRGGAVSVARSAAVVSSQVVRAIVCEELIGRHADLLLSPPPASCPESPAEGNASFDQVHIDGLVDEGLMVDVCLSLSEFSLEAVGLLVAEWEGRLNRVDELVKDGSWWRSKVQYVESGRSQPLRLDHGTVVEVLMLADQLGVQSLKDRCAEVIASVALSERIVDQVHIAQIEEIGKRFDVPQLIKLCSQIRRGAFSDLKITKRSRLASLLCFT
eukprot:ANDGO_03888.mRNA.1 Ultraviolet-B receptor UVR8